MHFRIGIVEGQYLCSNNFQIDIDLQSQSYCGSLRLISVDKTCEGRFLYKFYKNLRPGKYFLLLQLSCTYPADRSMDAKRFIIKILKIRDFYYCKKIMFYDSRNVSKKN